MLVFDSFAWVEYFAGSKKGEKVRDFVEDNKTIYTPSICLTEISAKYLRENEDPITRIKFIEKRSITVSLDSEIALLAGQIKIEKKLHTTDAIIYATGVKKEGHVVTGDPHFQGLDKVIML